MWVDCDGNRILGVAVSAPNSLTPILLEVLMIVITKVESTCIPDSQDSYHVTTDIDGFSTIETVKRKLRINPQTGETAIFAIPTEIDKKLGYPFKTIDKLNSEVSALKIERDFACNEMEVQCRKKEVAQAECILQEQEKIKAVDKVKKMTSAPFLTRLKWVFTGVKE